MRHLPAFALALACAASPAFARPSTTTMSCGEAAATVAKAGAIVLSTGEFTYERFVVHNGLCLPGEIVEPATAPTVDSPACPIGYVCRQRQLFEDFND